MNTKSVNGNNKRILILAANPKDTKKLRLDEEVRVIEEGLKRSLARDQFELITKWAVQTDDLRRALLEHKPHIVHFLGHGTGTSGIALENGSGQTHLVKANALQELFDIFRDDVECILLNACYSDEQASAIYECIDTVIGIRQTIEDQAAIKFSIGFYDALGAGENYQKAYKLGRNAINLDGMSDNQNLVLHHRQNNKQEDTNQKSLEDSVNSTQSAKNLAFAIAGNLKETNKPQFDAIVEILQKISGDTSIVIVDIQESSIRLILGGSSEGLQRLKELYDSGKLSTILDIPVEYVRFSESSKENSKKSEDSISAPSASNDISQIISSSQSELISTDSARNTIVSSSKKLSLLNNFTVYIEKIEGDIEVVINYCETINYPELHNIQPLRIAKQH
ncbi:MAG: CHAT domain-containing protein, partial [Cyanobacteria bacterium P01_F01_bin.116]